MTLQRFYYVSLACTAPICKKNTFKSRLEKSHVFYNNILNKKTEKSWKMTSKMDPLGHLLNNISWFCASHFVRSEKWWILRDFGQGPAAGVGVCLKLRFCRVWQKIQHAQLPLKGVRRILRASPPAAGPLNVTGIRDLWFLTCGFVFAFAALGVPGTGWELLFASLEMLWRTLRDLRISSWTIWGSQARFKVVWDAILEGWRHKFSYKSYFGCCFVDA